MTLMIPAWKNGVLTPVDKLEVHRAGLRHKAVSVFVMHGDETLLQQRANGKYHTPGLWTNSCCTHPEWDESPLDCAQRRLSQELGITGLQPEFRQRLEYRADVGNGLTEHELVDVFIAQAPMTLPIHPNPDEVMAIRWAPLTVVLDEMAQHPERFTPWFRIYLSEHRQDILPSTSP